MDGTAVVILSIVGAIVGIFLFYYIIKWAVRNAILEATEMIETEKQRVQKKEAERVAKAAAQKTQAV